jgi:hypothetical protein
MRLSSTEVGVQTMNLSTRTVGVIGMTQAMMMITNTGTSDPTEGASINNVRASDSVQSARPSRHAKTVRIQKT